MPFKTTASAFTVSLAAHALLAASFGLPLWENKESGDQTVEISYVRRVTQAPPAYQQIKYAPIPGSLKKIEPQIVPRPRASEASQTASAPVVSPQASSVKVRNSEEFLTNPQKGKVFLNYFGLIKQRVRRAVEKKYSGEPLKRGDVSLVFVLKSDGAVVNVFVVEKDSSADEAMRDFAVRCVKDCSPFPHFPKELGMERISFNLSILFDET